jgi:hypothetical protein
MMVDRWQRGIDPDPGNAIRRLAKATPANKTR